MLIDKNSTFAWQTNFFGAAATAKIGDAMNLTAFPTDMGEGYPLYLVTLITTAMVGGTSVQFNLVTDSSEALTTAPVTLVSSSVILTAEAIAGSNPLIVALPKADYKQWLGLTVTRVGISTAGAVSAFLTQDPPNWRAYAEGLN